ncbi:MAG: acyltransferase [Bacteroidaceae bacterium]|nr:acyltransferase [Bacteroidaceae bacterium]
MPAKQHYIALDGLRGIAALVVISYHVFEGFATSPATQTLNHGYLAVDFFFILSGFVMAYAYDSRWTRMTTGTFLLRRLIRLHPMVIAGSILGVATFLLQGSEQWDHTHVPFTSVALAFLLGALLLPVFPGSSAEVRGNGELFPLNGPTWSLFFEYIGNILYAILLRRVSNAVLIAITCTLGIVLSYICIANGQLGVGWTAADGGIWGGLIRMSFSYSLGMLIARTFRPKEMRIPFWVSAAALTLFCIMPYAGINGNPVWNGLYDAFCVVVVFPIILVLTAGSPKEKSLTSHTCKFIGDLSYPLYAIHYPFMYLFFAYVWNNQLSFAQAWPYALVTVIGSILLATFLHYFYEKPLRKHLTSKLKD